MLRTSKQKSNHVSNMTTQARSHKLHHFVRARSEGSHEGRTGSEGVIVTGSEMNLKVKLMTLHTRQDW